MFNLFKQKIPLNRVVNALVNSAFRPLSEPTEQDLLFREQAIAIGVNKTRFLFEVAALELVTVGSTINTLALLRKIHTDEALHLLDSVITAYREKLENEMPSNVRADFKTVLKLPNGDAIFKKLAGRIDEYANLESPTSATKHISNTFIQLCGVEDQNEVLFRIAWSVFATRGNMYLRELKRTIIVRGT